MNTIDYQTGHNVQTFSSEKFIGIFIGIGIEIMIGCVISISPWIIKMVFVVVILHVHIPQEWMEYC